MFIYFWEREHSSRGGADREGDNRIWIELCADSREPEAGLHPTNGEIMTWAEVEVGRLTKWTTQAPPTVYF